LKLERAITANSDWAALQNPIFRRMWIASVISGSWVVAHDNAATGAVSALTSSPCLISLVSTAASLSFFFYSRFPQES
jgi:hypothetical protein